MMDIGNVFLGGGIILLCFIIILILFYLIIKVSESQNKINQLENSQPKETKEGEEVIDNK